MKVKSSPSKGDIFIGDKALLNESFTLSVEAALKASRRNLQLKAIVSVGPSISVAIFPLYFPTSDLQVTDKLLSHLDSLSALTSGRSPAHPLGGGSSSTQKMLRLSTPNFDPKQDRL